MESPHNPFTALSDLKAPTVMPVRNGALCARITELGYTQAEVVAAVNDAILRRTGRPGRASDRWLRMLRTGAVTTPRAHTLAAMIDALGVSSAADIGFVDRKRPTTDQSPQEASPMHRRKVLTGLSAAALAMALPKHTHGAVPRLTLSDVHELKAPLAELVTADDAVGGAQLARAAAKHGAAIKSIVANGDHGTHVADALRTLAGECFTNAAWFAVDDDETTSARHHLNQAAELAAVANSAELSAHVLNSTWHLAMQRQRYGDTKPIARAARACKFSRTHPAAGALFLAYRAKAHGYAGEPGRVARALDQAHEALTRQSAPLPIWAAFIDAGEIHHQGAHARMITEDRRALPHALHDACAAVEATRDGYSRNKTIRCIRASHAALLTGEDELAAHFTAQAAEAAGTVVSGRITARLQQLRTTWTTVDSPRAPDAIERLTTVEHAHPLHRLRTVEN